SSFAVFSSRITATLLKVPKKIGKTFGREKSSDRRMEVSDLEGEAKRIVDDEDVQKEDERARMQKGIYAMNKTIEAVVSGNIAAGNANQVNQTFFGKNKTTMPK